MSSNVLLTQIQQQLNGNLPPRQQQMIQTQIATLQNTISTMDKTDLTGYSTALERLYMLQNRIANSNVHVVNTLLVQKIQVLEQLTNCGNN
jgi:hypothetical protein